MADELTPSGPNLAPTSGVNVNLVSWFFLMVSVLAISARIMVKWSSCRRFHGDDILALLALVRRHLGRATNDLDTDSRRTGP